MGNYFEAYKIVGGRMVWHCLDILDISLWVSDGMSGKNGEIYFLLDLFVRDEVKAHGGVGKVHHDEGMGLGGEGMDLYDKNLDLVIGLLFHHIVGQLGNQEVHQLCGVLEISLCGPFSDLVYGLELQVWKYTDCILDQVLDRYIDSGT